MATSKFNYIYRLKPVLCLGLTCFFITGCFSRSAIMTYSVYDSVQTGMSVSNLMTEVGKPYAIHVREDGFEEYEYIERINTGSHLIAENHYYILIKDGAVVSKYMKQEGPPPYDLIYQEEPNYP